MKLELTKKVKIGNRWRKKGTVMEVSNARGVELLAKGQSVVFGESEKIVTQQEDTEEKVCSII